MPLLLDRFCVTQTLDQSIQITQSILKAFATGEDFSIKMTIAFGDRFDAKVVQGLAQDWSRGDFTTLPPIAILSTVEINNAMGAFAKATNTIYLSREYLAQNAGNPEAVASVLLEEVGHYIDSRINEFETPGDEGAIFSALVRQEKLSDQKLQQLRSEDDSATIILDGQMIQIEQATFTGTNGDDILPISGTGNGGDDTINPGLGRDTINGGSGTDVLIVDYSTNPYQGINYGSWGANGSGGFNGTFYAYKDARGNYDAVTFSNIEQFNLTGTNFADTLNGGDLSDTLIGNGGNDSLNGGKGDDFLDGGDGNDIIDAGAGNDTIDAGAGNDTITGGGGIDVINGGAGIDTLSDANFATATTALAFDDTGTTHDPITLANGTSVTGIEYFEGLQTGSGNDTITYTQVRNNTINTGGGNDTINPGLGRDTIDGGSGTDVLIVDYSTNPYQGINYASWGANGSGGFNGTFYAYKDAKGNYDAVTFSNIEQFNLTGTNFADTLNGGDLSDTLIGNGGNDSLNGGKGDDFLDGGDGNDTLIGGLGNDTYVINTTADTITEKANEGLDTVVSSIDYTLGETSNLENLTLTGTSALNGTGNSLNNLLTGNSGNNTLTGLGGNDTLDGGTGIDVLIGGDGNDTYIVDSTTDTITETASGGVDTVVSSVSYTLGETSNLENLTLTGTSALKGTGNSLNNLITGNSGANTLQGGGGIDTLIGGDGNDTYIVDSTTDTITETASGGVDTVQSSVSYTLGETSNLEKLILTGTSAIKGTGNSYNNLIRGNSGVNLLTGLDGNDTLIGGAGNDTLIGGAGNDVLTGGLGKDGFTFNTFNEGMDTISDFQANVDQIYISAAGFGGGLVANKAIAASQVLFGSGVTAATNSNQRFLYNTSTGALFFDADGNGSSSAAIQLATLTHAPTLTNTDIFVIA